MNHSATMDMRGKPGHSGAELGDTGTKRSSMINRDDPT